jgi:NTP pyrophosphatase (non-canonical NTP hydrolase)
MNVTKDERIKLVLEHFAPEKQKMKCIEECGELITALAKGKGVIEEIADVIIMANQMRLLFGKDKVDEKIKQKLGRTMELVRYESGKKQEKGFSRGKPIN